MNNQPTDLKPVNSNPQDVFADLSKLTLNQSFDALTSNPDYVLIPVHKPGKQSFIRVSPDPKHAVQLAALEVDAGAGGDRELYIVQPNVVSALADLSGLSNRLVVLCVARPENDPFLWALKLPSGTSRQGQRWAHSALEIARRAKAEWVRVESKVLMGCYVAHPASAKWPDPVWPDLDMGELLRRGFGEKFVIDSPQHPVVRALRGED